MDKIEIATKQIKILETLQDNCFQCSSREEVIVEASKQILELLKYAFPDTSIQDSIKDIFEQTKKSLEGENEKASEFEETRERMKKKRDSFDKKYGNLF